MFDRLKRLVDKRGALIARGTDRRRDLGMKVELDGCRRSADHGVNWTAGNEGGDCLSVLVNEENWPFTGVEVEGLSALNGTRLDLLCGAGGVAAPEGGLITCLQRPEVKVSAGGRLWESYNRIDRDYAGVVNQEPVSTPAPGKKGSVQ